MTLILRGTFVAAALLPDVNCWPYRSDDFAQPDTSADRDGARPLASPRDDEDAKGIIDTIGR